MPDISAQELVASWIPKPWSPPTQPGGPRGDSIEPGASDKLIDAMIKHESAGNPEAVSSKGAVGLMQLMPKTAKALGVDDPTDPEQNRAGGKKYIEQLISKFDGDHEKALVAYNWGPGHVMRAGDNWKSKAPRGSRLYARKIMQDAGMLDVKYSPPWVPRPSSPPTQPGGPRGHSVEPGAGYPSPGIIPSAVAGAENMLRSAKDTVASWLAHPQDEADLKKHEIASKTTTPASLEASASGGELKMDPLKSQAERGGELASGMVGAGVIKEVGGQWLTKGVEEALGELKKSISKSQIFRIDNNTPHQLGGEENIKMAAEINKNPIALNSWIDGALRKYVLNRMATPDDEIRQLAEGGVLHVDPETLMSMTKSGMLMHRKDTPFPLKGLGVSEHAKKWESAADTFVRKSKAGDIAGEIVEGDAPWLKKLDPNTPVYTALNRSRPAEVGFDHLVDVLGEKLATGELRPEQLSKVSVRDAVQMAHEYNQAAEAKMLKSRKAAQEGMTVHKEYPEGWKWVQLDKPGQFAAESDAMGHSVRGYEPPAFTGQERRTARGIEDTAHPDWIPASGDSGYEDYGHGGWDAIKSGKAKVYSLRDPKGESQVTVEVGRSPGLHDQGERMFDTLGHNKKTTKIWADYLSKHTDENFEDYLREKYPEEWQKISEKHPEEISQIKGKLNKKPSEAALPYVQDFVRSGEWSDVGDFSNTDLHQTAPGKYISSAEVEALSKKHFGTDIKEGLHPNGPDGSETGWYYYRRIARMQPDILSETDKAFIKDVEQTAEKPKPSAKSVIDGWKEGK